MEQLVTEPSSKDGMKSGLKSTGSKEIKKNVRIRDPADHGQNRDQKMFLDVIDTIETVSDVIKSGYQSTSMADKSITLRRTSKPSNDFELSESYL